MIKNKYIRSHFDQCVYFKNLKDRLFVAFVCWRYVGSIKEQGENKEAEGIANMQIWNERSWKGKKILGMDT